MSRPEASEHPKAGATPDPSANAAILAALWDVLEEGVVLLDRSGCYRDANPAACRILGRSREQLLGRHPEELAEQGWTSDLAWRAFQAVGRQDGTFPLQHPDGEVRVLAYRAVAHLQPGLHLGIIRDVTELEESRRSFEVVFRGSPVGLVITETEGETYIDANEAFLELTGYSRDELVGRTALELGVYADPAQREALTAELAGRGHVDHFEITGRHRSGTLRHVLLSAEPVELQGKPCVLSAAVDITTQREAERAKEHAEQQFLQVQKMECIGRLAGGIAHDFNNVLSAIEGYAGLLRDDLEPGSPMHEDAEEVLRAVGRASRLTRQLLAFARKRPVSPRTVHTNRLIEELSRMLQRVLGETIDLELCLQPDAGNVHVDSSQLENALINLAVNARDAMPRGGRLTVATDRLELGSDREVPGLSAGSWVRIRATDTGVGMDEPTRARVFEPFFTTKATGEGTGLGLAGVWSTVSQSGGHVRVQSAPGRGATFELFLPREDEAEPQAPSTVPQPSSLQGQETVLLVEDDDHVRRLARQVLARAGYTVIEAANAGDALLASEQEGRIHLLLSDVMMPRLTGPQLGERLVRDRPDMKRLYMSGHAAALNPEGGAPPILSKPFGPRELLARVRSVLDRGEER